MPQPLRVPFGWKDERLWEPRQVPNGKGCGCICPACRRILIARQNHQTPHFAHAPGEDCAKAVETAIHLAAKQLIADRQELRLPVLTFNDPFPHPFGGGKPKPEVIYLERTIHLASVRLEEWLGDIRPDIVVTSGTDIYLVEIAVTHFVDAAKQAKIDARQVPTVEIDVSQLRRQQITFSALADLLFINQPYSAEWLYHPKIAELTRLAWEEDQITKSIAALERQEQEIADKVRAEEKRVEAAAQTARFAKIDQYRKWDPARKLAAHCRSIGLTPAQLRKLSTFVPWEKKWYCSRDVWQSAVLAYLANEQAVQTEMFGRYLPAEIDPKVCLMWLEVRFPIDPANDDNKHAVAYWKYIHYLLGIGVLWKGEGGYYLNLPPETWAELKVNKLPPG